MVRLGTIKVRGGFQRDVVTARGSMSFDCGFGQPFLLVRVIKYGRTILRGGKSRIARSVLLKEHVQQFLIAAPSGIKGDSNGLCIIFDVVVGRILAAGGITRSTVSDDGMPHAPYSAERRLGAPKSSHGKLSCIIRFLGWIQQGASPDRSGFCSG